MGPHGAYVAVSERHSVGGYTAREETVNGLTHGVGVGLSAAGLVVLIVCAAVWGTVWHVVGFSIFGASLFVLYLASTVYHSLGEGKVKRVFKVLDHSAIYLLIAGTYTPFMLVDLRGVWGWSIFGVIWGCAILGVIVKGVFVGRFHKTSVAIYVGMGWSCVVVFKQLLINVGHLSLLLLFLGGASYTSGVVFYAWRRLPYHHGVWHVFVLGGSVLHYFAVLATLGTG